MWFDEQLLDDLDNEIEEKDMLKKYIFLVSGEFPILGIDKADAERKVQGWLREYKPKYVDKVTYAYAMEMKDGAFVKMEEE